MVNQINVEELLPLAKELVAALEKDDQAQAAVLIERLTFKPNFDIVLEIGKVVKTSNSALNSLYSDKTLEEIKRTPTLGKPKNLEEVIALADRAANETLDGVQSCHTIVQSIQARADTLEENFSDQAVCPDEVTRYISETRDAITELSKIYSNITVAQSFQDLIGQSIRANIATILDIQNKLVRIIRMAQDSTGKQLDTEIEDTDGGGHQDDGEDIDQFLSDMGL